MIAICLSFKQIGYPSDPMTDRKHNLRVIKMIKMIKITHKKNNKHTTKTHTHQIPSIKVINLIVVCETMCCPLINISTSQK